MELRNLVESYILNEKLSQEEVNEYVQEYFIHEFMYIYGLIEDLTRHQTYQRIVKELVKQDKRFSNIVAIVDNFVKDNETKYPPETLADALQRYLIKQGCDAQIIEDAFEKFKKEELNNEQD